MNNDRPFDSTVSNPEHLKTLLKDFCVAQRIDCVGIAPCGPYDRLEKQLRAKKVAGYYTEFEEGDISKRVDPRLTMPTVQSVIVALFPYFVGNRANANLAKYAWVPDYHCFVPARLEQIGQFLSTLISGLHYEAYTDNGPLVDRYLAYLAGLGIYGLNGSLINHKYGSYCFIGYMLVDYPFPADEPLPGDCGQCGRCMKACPGQCLRGQALFIPQQCRSYLTQKKGALDAAELAILRQSSLIFGCDICQDVCPHNLHALPSPLPECQGDVLCRIDRQDIASLSNREFKCKFGSRAFSWRGKKQLIRNFDYLV